MLINSVHLRNIKCFEDQALDLHSGLTAITGENGAGKSTIVEAIGYALFGYSDGPLGGLMREGTRSSEIRVRFMSPLDSREYESVRSLRKNRSGTVTTSAKVLDAEAGGTLAEGGDEVGKFLRFNLGLADTALDPKSIFSDVVGVPQGRLTADFVDTARSRKRKFDPLLGTEDYRAAYDALRLPASLLGDRLAELNTEAAAKEERLKDLPANENRIQATGKSRHEAGAKLKRANSDLAKAQAATATLLTAKEQLDRLDSESREARKTEQLISETLQSAVQAVQESEAARLRAEASRDEAERFQKTETQLSEQQSRQGDYDRIASQLSAAEGTVALLKDRRERAEDDLQRLLAVAEQLPNLEAAERYQATLESELKVARDRLARLRFHMDRADEIAHDLKAAQAELDDANRIAREAREAQPLAGRVASLQRQIADASAALSTIDSAVEELERTGLDLRDLKREVNEDSQELAAVEQATDATDDGGRNGLPRLRVALGRAIHRGLRLADLYEARLAAVAPERRSELEIAVAQSRKALERAHEAQTKVAAIDSAEDQIEQLTPRIQDLRVRAAHAEAAVVEHALEMGAVETLQNEIDDLGTPDPRGRVEQARTELQGRTSIEQVLASASAKLADSRTHQELLRKRQEPLQDAQGSIERLRETLDALRDIRDQHLRDSALAEGLPKLHRGRERARVRVAEAKGEVARTSRLLMAAEEGFDADELDQATEIEANLQRDVGGIHNQISEYERELRRLRKEEKALLEVKVDLEQTVRSIERTERVMRVMALIRNALRDAGPIVTKALLSGVSSAANEIFCQIMGNYAQSLEWDEEYGIWVESGGYRRSFQQLSGGEQITAALSVRLALLRELLRIDVAFLDEPTQNLDLTRRENLAEQIQRLTGFSQLFVISHDDTFERLLQSVIHVEKVDGVSGISAQ